MIPGHSTSRRFANTAVENQKRKIKVNPNVSAITMRNMERQLKVMTELATFMNRVDKGLYTRIMKKRTRPSDKQPATEPDRNTDREAWAAWHVRQANKRRAPAACPT